MKKGWKIFWIVCGVLFASGAALCIVGFAFGGSFASVEQAVRRGMTSIDAIDRKVERLEDGIENRYEDEDFEEQSQDQKSYDGIDHLEIDVAALSVQIRISDDDRVWVEAEGIPSELNYRCYQEGNSLEIETESDWTSLAGIKDQENQEYQGTLRVAVPEKKLAEISISNRAGEIYIEHLEAGEFSLETGAGKAVVDNFIADEAELSCGAGQIQALGEILGGGDISCDAGNVDLKLRGGESNYRCQIEECLGKVNFGKHQFDGGRGEHFHGEGRRIVEIECAAGNVDVTFED